MTALAALESGADRAERDDQRHRPARSCGRSGVPERQGARSFGTINTSERAEGLLGHLLLPARRADGRRRGRCIQRWAKQLGFGRTTGIDLPGERPGLVPDSQVAQRRLRGATAQCVEKAGLQEGTTAALYECGGIERGWSARRQRQPRRRPGRPAGHAAAGRGRLLRAGQQRHDRARRTSARRSRTATASRSRSCAPSRERKVKLNQRDRQIVLDGLRGAAQRGGRHVRRRLQGLADEAVPGLRQDRHGGAPAEPRPGVVRVLRQGRRPADRGRRDRREGRLRRGHCGTRGASHPL